MQNETNIFDEVLNEDLKEEVVVEKPVQKAKPQTSIQEKPQNQVVPKTMAESFLQEIRKGTQLTGEKFDEKSAQFAVSIIQSADKVIRANGQSWQDIDFRGNKLPEQVKRWAKLGVNMDDKLFVDIRPNRATNMLDIQIKAQYQTVEKLIVKYFAKEVLSFKEDVICVGDVFEKDFDFATGQEKVIAHKKNNEVDRNNLENITGAYKIVYYKDSDGTIKQIVCEIDKNRILRGMNASSSREKTVWKLDTRKMVLKTATWELWNSSSIRPFMQFPDDIINDIGVVNDSEEMDWNKETKHKDVIEAQADVKCDVATGEVIDF